MSLWGSHDNRRQHPVQAPGFGTTPDPFAGISQRQDNDDDDAYARNASTYSHTVLTYLPR